MLDSEEALDTPEIKRDMRIANVVYSALQVMFDEDRRRVVAVLGAMMELTLKGIEDEAEREMVTYRTLETLATHMGYEEVAEVHLEEGPPDPEPRH